MKWYDFLKQIFLKLPHRSNGRVEEVGESTSHKIALSYINWDLIRSIEDYDVVIVKMKEEKIEQDQIDFPHRKRPFVITGKNEKTEMIQGYYLTSNLSNPKMKKENMKGSRLVLRNDIYRLAKNSLVLMDKEEPLPYQNIYHKVDHLLEKDIAKLKKYRALLCGQEVISDKQNMVVEIGDIVLLEGKNYIIYQEDNTKAYGYAISKYRGYVNLDQNPNYIIYNGRLFYVEYQDYKVFDKNKSLCILSRFNEKAVELIRENKKRRKALIKQKEKSKIR